MQPNLEEKIMTWLRRKADADGAAGGVKFADIASALGEDENKVRETLLEMNARGDFGAFTKVRHLLAVITLKPE